jgi:hypothetical protein
MEEPIKRANKEQEMQIKAILTERREKKKAYLRLLVEAGIIDNVEEYM